MKNLLLQISRFTDACLYKNQIPVLNYHRVNDLPFSIDKSPSVDFFRQQIHILHQRGYYFASLMELIDWCKGVKTLPRKSVVLTFDDGYQDNYLNVFPILKEYQAKATIFLIYNCIGKAQYFSYNREIPQKILPEDYDPSKDLAHRYLSVKEIKEMHQSKLVEFGSHSLSHISLIYCHIQKAKEEIMNSKTALEHLIDIPVNMFCYPYGHYNETILKLVERAGYAVAVTTVKNKVKQNDRIFALPRIIEINKFVNLPPVIRKLGGHI